MKPIYGSNSQMISWSCKPSTFDWHYDRDEYIYVRHGSALAFRHELGFAGKTISLLPGATHLFKAGETWNWVVYESIEKVAVLIDPVPYWLGFILKINRKLKQIFRS